MLHPGARAEADEVESLSDRYEAALRRNDVAVLDAMFLGSDEVLRFGIADAQRGRDQLVAWRASAPPIDPARRITSRSVVGLAPGVVAVDLTFVDGDGSQLGRQSQTWIRRPEGWRIVRAHVSVVTAG